MILFRNKLNDDETCVLSLSLKQSFKTDEDNFKIHFLASGKSFKFITFNNEAVLRISSTPLKGTRILIFEVQLIEEGQVMFRYMERLTEKQHGKLFVLNLEDAENNTYSTAFICGVEFTLRQRCVIDIASKLIGAKYEENNLEIPNTLRQEIESIKEKVFRQNTFEPLFLSQTKSKVIDV